MSLISLTSPGSHGSDSHTWALVLAGGEGTRLRQLTTTHGGTPIPKQYCSLIGGHTMLEEAITRAEGVVPRERVCSIVAHQHRQWWSTLLAEHPSRNIIVQPRGRGTGIGILYSVLHIAARDPHARILVVPADHHVRDEPTLRQGLRAALKRVERQADRPVLVGLEPERFDPELGYILPGRLDPSGVQTVTRFIEKPDASQASALIGDGGLWNTFILASSVEALLSLFMIRYAPIALEMQVLVSHALNSGSVGGAWASLVDLYERLPTLDFSRDLLEGNESKLHVLPVAECGWSDLGTPGRVAETLKRLPPEHVSRVRRRRAPFLDLAAQHALYMRHSESSSAAPG
jgi:mannose-1-phosphate guanylyltransferase